MATVKSDVCVSCGKAATEFTDELSRRDYAISGLCQKCHDVKVIQEDVPNPDVDTKTGLLKGHIDLTMVAITICSRGGEPVDGWEVHNPMKVEWVQKHFGMAIQEAIRKVCIEHNIPWSDNLNPSN